MRVPLSWLREFVDVTVEPERLGADLTQVGLALDGLETDGKDAILDLDVTTNRVDCMNVYGVAREVAVVYGLPLKPPALDFAEVGRPASESLGVEVLAHELCPRFCARVLDVRLAPSPAWLRDRLEALGVRAINNAVDLTNYVMLELGHPAHAFDLERVPDGRLVVRWAQAGEQLTTLDGVSRTLHARAGVVAGPREPLALAGVMGGATSEVSGATRVVALEAAYWDPLSIRRAARSFGMHTEASHRFERGADPEAPPLAIARFAHLLERIGAGSARPGSIDVRPVARQARTTRLRPARLAALLGVAVPEPRIEAILGGLGFGLERDGATALRVAIPSWRGDVSREADLVEEVARHQGLDAVPSTLPPAAEGVGLKPAQARERALRDLLVGAGLQEVVSYAFVAETRAGAAELPLLRLANPLSEDQNVLRRTLCVPGLLGCLEHNLRQGRRELRLFEIGRGFAPGRPLPREERRLGLLLHGPARPGHWSERARPADFFDVKGLLTAAARRVAGLELDFDAGGAPAFLHPGRSAVARAEGRTVGFAGALHPDVAAAWDLREAPVVGEIVLDDLLEAPRRAERFRALPRFPAVSRDLSVVWHEERPAALVEATVRRAGGERLAGLAIADRFAGAPLPPGKVSLTLALRFADPARTLTGEEVQEALERVVAALEAAGAEIRRG